MKVHSIGQDGGLRWAVQELTLRPARLGGILSGLVMMFLVEELGPT